MSRSIKKNLFGNIYGAKSDKLFKKEWHQKYRQKEKQKLRKYVKEDIDNYIPTDIHEISNLYYSAKEFKVYYSAYNDNDDDTINQKLYYRK